MVNLGNLVRKAKEGYKILKIKEAEEKQAPILQTSIQFPSELKAVLEEKEEEFKFEGFEVPRFELKKVKPGGISKAEEEKIELTYNLIPKKPGKGERVFCYAKIFWDPKLDRYVYHVIEPKLSPELENIFKRIKELLEQKLEIDFLKVKRAEAIEYLKKSVDELLDFFGFKVSDDERQVLYYYIQRDFAGLGKIEPLMVDDEIEDISCDGLNIPIYVFHRHPKLGSLQTNIIFTDPNELDSFIIRLAQLCGKSVSVANPLTGGTLPDGSRLQAMLATDIARRGSNFTIRKFTHEPLTPVHLLNYGTVDVKVLAYLWFVVDMGRSILVSGGTASGKTTLLNVLSLFIRPERRIVSIEETAELKLPHPHWVPSVARTPMVVEEGKRIGEVDLFDLLRESLRQRPDHLIVGEVRGKEAYVLFQQMATGHPSLSTVHAENWEKLMDRLTSPPIALPLALLGSLDIVVFMMRGLYKDKHVRRVTEVVEIVGLHPKKKTPVTNTVFKWNSVSDRFDVVNKSYALKKISETSGLTEEKIKEELQRRMLVLNWMQEKNLTDYRDVYYVITSYYNYPERVISTILEGG